MEPDLRSVFLRSAPEPSKRLDISSLLDAGHRRRRRRAIAYALGGVGLAVTAAVLLPRIDIAEKPQPPNEPAETQVVVSPTRTELPMVFQNLDAAWTRAATPPEPRTEAVSVWSGRRESGRDLVLWGGSSGYGGTFHNEGWTWNPDTDTWIEMAESPLSPRAAAGAGFTGREIIIWGGHNERGPLDDGAAYDPDTDTWRALPPAPIGPAIPVASVFTGEEVIFWGSTDRDAGITVGAAYDPQTDTWREIAPAPFAINNGSGVWADGDPSETHEMIVLGGELGEGNRSTTDHAIGMAYDPLLDRWRRLPDVELSAQASVAAWTAEKLIAWDYGLNAAAYDRATDTWRELPELPLDDSECYPETEAFGVNVLASFCGQFALFDTRDDTWSGVQPPRAVVAGDPVLAGHVMLFAGATHESEGNALWIYSPPVKPLRSRT